MYHFIDRLFRERYTKTPPKIYALLLLLDGCRIGEVVLLPGGLISEPRLYCMSVEVRIKCLYQHSRVYPANGCVGRGVNYAI